MTTAVPRAPRERPAAGADGDATGSGPRTTARTGRRRPGPGWVPNQHGAWAMLVVPVVVGALRSGPTWEHLLLLVAWLVAYLAFFAAGQWLRARRRARWWPPVRAYGLAAAALGGVVVLLEPALLRWGLLLLPALALSLRWSWRREDRSLGNDLVTVAAACVMTAVAADLGSRTPDPGFTTLPSAEVLGTAGVLLLYFAGTVLYVKTMIRERGEPAWYRASVGYHVAVVPGAVALAAATGAARGGLLVALAAMTVAWAVRAAVVPRVWPGATPKALGIGEIVASTALAVVLVLG